MKQLRLKNSLLVFAILSMFCMVACTPLIGAYSPTAYKNATSLKAETLAFMDKASESYLDHKDEVVEIHVELSKAYEYVKGLPRNSISAKQWEILINKEGDLIGKFIKRWEAQGELSQIFIDEFKAIVSDAFDEIICLEANKQKASKCSNSEGGA